MLPAFVESVELYQVFSRLVSGDDYAFAIAHKLGKKHNTISQQLYYLEKQGLIKKGERSQAQRFVVNKEKLFKVWRECLHYSATEFFTGIDQWKRSPELKAIVGPSFARKTNPEEINSALKKFFADKEVQEVLYEYYLKPYCKLGVHETIYTVLVDRFIEFSHAFDFEDLVRSLGEGRFGENGRRLKAVCSRFNETNLFPPMHVKLVTELMKLTQ